MLTIEELEKLEQILPKATEIITKLEQIYNLDAEMLAKTFGDKIDELKKALDGTEEEAKKALKEAIKIIEGMASKIYGYGYPEPNEAVEKNEAEDKDGDTSEVVEKLEEYEAKINELSKAVEEKEKVIEELSAELTFERRKKVLENVAPEENWDDLKQTIVKLGDDEFNKMVEKLARPHTSETKPTLPEKSSGTETISDLFKNYLNKF